MYRTGIVQSKSTGDTLLLTGNMAFSMGPTEIGPVDPVDAGYIFCLSKAMDIIKCEEYEVSRKFPFINVEQASEIEVANILANLDDLLDALYFKKSKTVFNVCCTIHLCNMMKFLINDKFN